MIAGLDIPRIQLNGSLLDAIALPSLPSGAWGAFVAGVLTVALIASVESLLTAVAVDRMQSGSRSNLDRELVGQGAARPLEEDLVTAVQVHGSDGLGELDSVLAEEGTPRYPQVRLPSVLSTAQDVWNECVRRYPDEVTLITLGPLTNVAVALKVNPLTVQKFRSVIVMGGAIGVPGNVAPAAEFNMYVDPHAAHRVFQASLPLTLVPLDVTTRVGVTRESLMTWVAESRAPLARMTTDMTRKAFEFAEKVEGHGLFYFHDPLAVLAAVDSSLLKVEPLHVSVEMAGRVSRGITIADRRQRTPEEKARPNMRVADDVDVDRTLSLLRNRLCP
jgi:inosine-uridine nucleoside N-ribohydrolase